MGLFDDIADAYTGAKTSKDFSPQTKSFMKSNKPKDKKVKQAIKKAEDRGKVIRQRERDKGNDPDKTLQTQDQVVEQIKEQAKEGPLSQEQLKAVSDPAGSRLATLGLLPGQKQTFNFKNLLKPQILTGIANAADLIFGNKVVGQNTLEKLYQAQQQGIPAEYVIRNLNNKEFNELVNIVEKLKDPNAKGSFLANTLKIDGEPVANIGDLLTTAQSGIPTAADPTALKVLELRKNNPDLTFTQSLGFGTPDDFTSQVDAKKALGPRLDKVIQTQNPELYYGDTEDGGYGFKPTNRQELEMLASMDLQKAKELPNSSGLVREIANARMELDRMKGDRGGDRDPISGQQPSEPTVPTDPTDPTDPADPSNQFVSRPGAFYTFFDPVLGKYRTGTYDEYLQYVTAKDGGIIQLQEGGDPMEEAEADNVRDRAAGLRQLIADIKEFSNVKPETEGQMKVKEETDKMLKDELMKPLPLGSGIMMAENDQPAESLYREDLGPFKKLGDSALSLFMEPLRKSNIGTGSPADFIDEAINTLIAQERLRPGTSYDDLTDKGKELVTQMAEQISRAERTRPDGGLQMDEIQADPIMYEDPRGKLGFEQINPVYKMREGMPERYEQINPVLKNVRFPEEPKMFNVANGGIIALKDGGMDDMMQADSLMFRDPSDEGEWEYNV